MIQPSITAQWRKLLLVNYEVDPKVLDPFLPYDTEYALWNNKCYVSLVGFQFLNVRIGGVPIPFHTDFDEINLRFYVRRKSAHIWHYGVVFIKEIVSLPIVTFVANTLFTEHYETLPLKHDMKVTPEKIAMEYQWKKHEWQSFSIESGPSSHMIEDNTEEHFLTSQHWGFSKANDHKTIEYSVEHPRWSAYSTRRFDIKVDFRGTYGDRFAFLDNATPESVFLTEGSDITLKKRVVLKL
jgi:uncharacterized protein YqjF (DUF2071 family)